MRHDPPRPLSAAELRARRTRARRIARRLGFAGRVEYRHVSTNSGGAEYGLGPTPQDDVLLVYAKAFERDANPNDFSLEAMIAHERGHQLCRRHARLAPLIGPRLSIISEEFVASLLGSLIAEAPLDREHLYLKAAAEAMNAGLPRHDALRLAAQVRGYLEMML